jgi:hypothetical protein
VRLDQSPPNEPAFPGPHRFDAVLIGGDLALGAAAIGAAGGRVAGRFGWGEELRVGGNAVLLVEAEGSDEATLADVLPAIARYAAERGCRVVAALDPDAIDVVAASLWGPMVELLVGPDLPARVAALTRAAAPEAPTVVRDDGIGANGGPAFGVEPSEVPLASADELRRAIRARRMRDGFFMPGLFADPAWDMLLDLYAAELEGHAVSVSSLCIAAAVAPTTALRWIARMQEDGLLERRPDGRDRRRAFMGLTEVARVGMMNYLDALRRAGVGVA